MKLFLSDIALRECCYDCNFKIGNKYSDLTLGDFWGVNKYYPDMYNKSGVSAIIINTEKGKNIFVSIKDDIIYKDCQLDEIISGNPSLRISGSYPNKRNEFFKDLEINTISDLSSKYVKKVSLFKKLINKGKRIIKKVISKG